MAEGVWAGHGISIVILIAVICLALFFILLEMLQGICKLLGFSRGDTIAGAFCGTKKSLASGVPLAKVMFGNSPALGMIILPFVIYHLLQLVTASILARRWAATADAYEAEQAAAK